MYDTKDSPLLKEISALDRKRPPSYTLLSFFLLLLVISLLSEIPSFFYLFASILSNRDAYFALLGGDIEIYNQAVLAISGSEGFLLTALLSQALTVTAALLFTRFIAKRRLSTIGLCKKNAALFYVGGFLFGVILFGLSLLLCSLNRSVTMVSNPAPATGWILLFLIGFMIQGASEEFLFRGVLMSSLLESQSPIYAILTNALLFSVMHTGNAGFSNLALVNIFLFGIFLSILTLRTGSIFPALALHAAWNFAEGCLFGTSVSGMPALPSLFVSTADPAKWLTNGGAFGPEGGIAVSVVLLLALLLVCLLPSTHKNAKKG